MHDIKKHYSGYIEGFYGKLLSWDERIRILKVLHDFNFNTYFYAPKEDPFHRFMWRKRFSSSWIRGFKKFARKAKEYKIQLIAGISPGLDFQYQNEYLVNITKKKEKTDFEILISKLKQLIEFGSQNVAVLLDDIPENLVDVDELKSSEGSVHSHLINNISKKLSMPIYFVPRIYACEIEHKNCNYMHDVFSNLDKKNSIFFCGKNIVEKSIQKNFFSEKLNTKKHEIIYWDNLYANDYCPKKVFLGTWYKRNPKLNIMVNLTGNVEIDTLNLYLVAQKRMNLTEAEIWKNAFKKFRIPNQFLSVIKFFSPQNSFSIQDKDFFILEKLFFEELEYLLWKWKSSLSLELFPFLLCLKQELEMYNNKTKINRIIKTQTITLAKILSKERVKL